MPETHLILFYFLNWNSELNSDMKKINGSKIYAIKIAFLKKGVF